VRTEVANAAAEAARVRFVRYCRAQGWDCWGLWLAMGYDDDWLGSLYDDGKPLADPPALPMPTVAELRRGALYLGVSFERLLEVAWGVSTSSLAAHDARSFGERTPRRFGIPQPSGLLTGPWPGGSSGAAGPPPEAGSIWAATLEGIRSGRGDVVHCVCRRLGEAIVALHVAPAWEPEDFWAAPALRPRAASHEGDR
jgi:hypothetical protein